jgi:hypothetical protein
MIYNKKHPQNYANSLPGNETGFAFSDIPKINVTMFLLSIYNMSKIFILNKSEFIAKVKKSQVCLRPVLNILNIQNHPVHL